MSKFNCLFVCYLLLCLNACGDRNDSSRDKTEVEKKGPVIENAEPKTEEQKKETSTGADEDKNRSNELGMTPGLPANFPSDIPQPKNAKTLGSLNSSEGTVVTFESTDMVPDIVNFYKEEMKKNGYAISEGGENLVSDKGGLINWKKDSKEVGLMLGYDKDKNITSLVITYK